MFKGSEFSQMKDTMNLAKLFAKNQCGKGGVMGAKAERGVTGASVIWLSIEENKNN